MRISGARNSAFASSKFVVRTQAMYSGEKRITYFRGASPLGLPYTLARGGPAIPTPLAWAHSRPPPREALRRDLARALAQAGPRSASYFFPTASLPDRLPRLSRLARSRYAPSVPAGNWRHN